MDLLTQGLLGSALAQTAANREQLRKAGLIGILAGLSADLDIFIQSSQDPLLNLEYHRHFTHSLFFVPVAALVLSAILWPFFRGSLSWGRVLLFCLLGYMCSGLLDACTSYGTRLLWPISNERFSFNIISIVDPVFTLLLIVGVIAGFVSRRRLLLIVCLCLAASYLSVGFKQRNQVYAISAELAETRGHQAQRPLVKPTLGNLFLWRSVYLSDGRFYIDAIRLNPVTGSKRIFEGESVAQYHLEQAGVVQNSVLYRDIERFAFFSDQYLARHPEQADMLIDVRYANLPQRIHPLWGIRIDESNPQQHALYETMRDRSPQTRNQFIDMLLDRIPSEQD